jgi:outer membrane protein TolC
MLKYQALFFSILLSVVSVSAKKPTAALKLNANFLEDVDFQENFDLYNSGLLFTEAARKPHSENIIWDKLEFQDFLKLVSENHPQILQAKLKRNQANAKRLETQGAFDPSLNSKNSYNVYNSSSAPGKEQEAFTSSNSLDILTRYGAKLSAGAKFAEGDIKTPLSPTGSGGEYFIEAQIPLLRDAIYNSKSIKEKSAILNEAIADLTLYRKQLDVLQKASELYWKWYASFKVLEVENHLVDLITEQSDFVKAQVEYGNLAQLAYIEVSTELQKRLFKRAKAERKAQEMSLALANYLWLESGEPLGLFAKDQVPSVKEDITKNLAIENINEAKLKALKFRPEFKAINLSKDIAVLERKFAKNQMLPELDLFINQGVETGEDSIGPTTAAGVNLSIPLRVRTGQGLKKQAELSLQSLNLASRELMQNVILELENAVSELEQSKAKTKFAKESLILANQLFEGESEKFKLGDSTLFLVIRRQRAMAEANIQYYKAFADYRTAEQVFKFLQGELI